MRPCLAGGQVACALVGARSNSHFELRHPASCSGVSSERRTLDRKKRMRRSDETPLQWFFGQNENCSGARGFACATAWREARVEINHPERVTPMLAGSVD